MPPRCEPAAHRSRGSPDRGAQGWHAAPDARALGASPPPPERRQLQPAGCPQTRSPAAQEEQVQPPGTPPIRSDRAEGALRQFARLRPGLRRPPSRHRPTGGPSGSAERVAEDRGRTCAARCPPLNASHVDALIVPSKVTLPCPGLVRRSRTTCFACYRPGNNQNGPAPLTPSRWTLSPDSVDGFSRNPWPLSA